MTTPVIAILGPTACGKSDLAQQVGLAIDGEVVSADSMQVYRGMDIGTAKLMPNEQLVPHHLIDILDPGELYSAQQFQNQSRALYADISARGKVPILCGGTGLYVQASLEDMRFPRGEQTTNPVRAKYEHFAEEHGTQALWDVLNDRDAASAMRIHPNNVRRVVRALEMSDEGISYADQVKDMRCLPEVVPSLRFALARDPEKLARRIDRRVDVMFEQGLVAEVQSLLERGFRNACTAPQAIGYKEVVAALDGVCTMDEAREQIKTATRRYAKRQRSWLRRDSRLTFIDADELDTEQIAAMILEQYRRLTSMDTD